MRKKGQVSQMCVLFPAIVMAVTLAVLFMPGRTEAGWTEDRFLYSTYTSWRHSYYYTTSCSYYPWHCRIEVTGSKEYERYSHKQYLYESASSYSWVRDLEYYKVWYAYYYDWVREEWGTEYYNIEKWQTMTRDRTDWYQTYYCYEYRDPITKKLRTVCNPQGSQWGRTTTEYDSHFHSLEGRYSRPWSQTRIVRNDYRSENVLEGPFTREGPYQNRNRTETTYDPPYEVKEWTSAPYDVIARRTWDRDIETQYWETRRDWGMREFQKYYDWRVYYKYYTKTGYEKETSRTLLRSGTNDHGIVRTGYDVLKQWTVTVENPYWRWANYTETRDTTKFQQKDWTSPPYTVPAQRWHDRYFWNVKFETRRDWALNEYQNYDVYEIQRKYYYNTDYYKIVGERKIDSGTRFVRTIATGTDVLNRRTYRLGCVPNTDPVSASRAEVVDLVCQAVAEGSGATVTSIRALNLPNVGTVNFTQQQGTNRWLARFFVTWFTEDGTYNFTIRVQGRDVEGNNVTHDIPMQLHVGNVSPDRPVRTIIIE